MLREILLLIPSNFHKISQEIPQMIRKNARLNNYFLILGASHKAALTPPMLGNISIHSKSQVILALGRVVTWRSWHLAQLAYIIF
jgi:hypothetical protein